MAKTLNEILATADWKEITPRLLYYADKLIRRCRWRGLCVQAELGAKICVEGFSADDFVQDAIDRLLSGQRNYSHSVSLEQNLKGIIRSTIWKVNKSSRHKGITDLPKPEGQDTHDPINELPGASPPPDALVIGSETLREQERMLSDFEKSLAGEEELSKLVSAFKAEHYTPRDVERFVGIPATRVSELKRKLRQRMERFEAYSG